MQGVSAIVRSGEVRAITTEGRGLTPEEWAEIALERLISISDEAPEPVRQQVHAFRERVKLLLIGTMKNAIRSDRTNVINLLTEAGHPELAKAVREL